MLLNKWTVKDYFYLEMMSYRVINYIKQISQKLVHFLFFQFVALSLVVIDN